MQLKWNEHMPIAYIDVPPGIAVDARRKLVKSLFSAIHGAWPIPDTRVFLREWSLDSVSQDGRLDMEPVRTICNIVAPPGVTVDGKRRLAKEITEALVEAYDPSSEDVPLPSGKVISTKWVLVFIHEVGLENAALDGTLAFENPMVTEVM
ncbi:phenylpyruvate tautomerase PptA (4-oxalocrotonate tautomerase family) [Devosia sp. UYZn731]|uniref:tautomerase family protein n=1 Tax=Devosia sp. UYZn731 TaxID=3156345 RepID=UPI0033936902